MEVIVDTRKTLRELAAIRQELEADATEALVAPKHAFNPTRCQ